MVAQQPLSDDQMPEGAPARRRRWPRRLARVFQWTVNAVALCLAALVFTPAGDRLAGALVHVDALTKADYIVVLGGNLERSVEAAWLYRDGWAGKLIVTSNPENAANLAHVAAMYGVPRGDIIIDPAATRTADHPRTVAAVSGVSRAQRFILVTSMYHTSRARRCFTAAGYADVCMRAPQWNLEARRRWVPNGMPALALAGDLPMMLYETFAWGFYKFRGWL